MAQVLFFNVFSKKDPQLNAVERFCCDYPPCKDARIHTRLGIGKT